MRTGIASSAELTFEKTLGCESAYFVLESFAYSMPAIAWVPVDQWPTGKMLEDANMNNGNLTLTVLGRPGNRDLQYALSILEV
eukprot:1605190-Amphidinium_carterae.2